MPGPDVRNRSTGSSRWTPVPRLGLLACGAILLSSCASGGQAPDETAGTRSVTAAPAPSTGGQQDGSVGPTSGGTHPVTTVVVSDDPTVSAAGTSGEGAWPGELAGLLAGSGAPLDLALAADAEAGFADAAGPSFTELVRSSVAPSTQLVLFSETRFGAAAAPDVARGAEEAFAAVEQLAPDARIVVIAPWPATSGQPAPSPEVRAAVREAAEGAEVAVTYVDPAAEGWPTGADQQQVGELLFREVAPLITALAESGAFD